MNDKEYIINKFKHIKSLGFIPSNRNNNTGIGKTFEDYIGVEENNFDIPDLNGFEIKSHRKDSYSFITLFTKAPDFPKCANQMLNERFGEINPNNSSINKLHTSMFANHWNNYRNLYSFKLFNDRNTKRVIIKVKDVINNNILDESAGYTYDTIEKRLYSKLKKLFYVTAENKKDQQGQELFYFTEAVIYEKPSLEKFLTLLDNGKIQYDIRLGSYSSGKNIGKFHDHGSGFRIRENDLILLYQTKEVVK